jgi:hypothetical protein
VKVAGRSKPEAEGRPWTRWQVIAKTGEVWTTFDAKVAADAEEAKSRGWFVRITDVQNQRYPDQMDIKTLTLIDPRQPNLPGTGADGKAY